MRIRLAVPSVTPKSVAENAPGPQSTSKVVLVPGADGSGVTLVVRWSAAAEVAATTEVVVGTKVAAEVEGAGPASTIAASQAVLIHASQ